MSANNLILSDKNRARYERKVLLRSGQSIFVEWELKKLGFRTNFPMRKVTSIYFDDLEFTALRDNIDGNPSRDKYRIRYYNNNVANCALEIKSKRSYSGYKKTVPLRTTEGTLEQAIRACREWMLINLDRHYEPTAVVSYERNYFVKDQFRATIDQKVFSGRWSGAGHVLSSALSALSYEVLEFKIPNDLDQDFRVFFQEFNKLIIRSTKSSKYSNALMY
ncbi:MAG: VTC domain-containing protein [Gammaproteobacteria bacterium]|nr:VTC domain-containing protein [Gammaproteobacteria bacterium]